jgi:hypothetical protein
MHPYTALASMAMPLWTTPPSVAGCTATAAWHSADGARFHQRTERYDAQGRLIIVRTEGPGAPPDLMPGLPAGAQFIGPHRVRALRIERDAAGCPVRGLHTDVADRGERPTTAVAWTATCHPDGSLATWSRGHHADTWHPPVPLDPRGGEEGWEQVGSRAWTEEGSPSLRQTWTFTSDHGMRVRMQLGGGDPVDVEVSRADLDPFTAVNPVDLLAYGLGGAPSITRDADGRLTAYDLDRLTRGVGEGELSWDPSEPVALLRRPGQRDAWIRCDGHGRCETDDRAARQTWTCPTR